MTLPDRLKAGGRAGPWRKEPVNDGVGPTASVPTGKAE